METLAIGGKNFVKASKVARDYGYTSDYIGQLCRAGKVEAQLVGRSWYVEVSSLENHKASRYKKTNGKKTSTQSKTEPQIGYGTSLEVEEKAGSKSEEVEVEVVKEQSFFGQQKVAPKRSVAKSLPKAPVTSSSPVTDKSFYTRLPKPLRPVQYDTDDSELIPTPKHLSEEEKTGEIKVNLADASSVKITAAKDQYSFETTKRPEVVFSGDLQVSSLPSDKKYELPEEKQARQEESDSSLAEDTKKPHGHGQDNKALGKTTTINHHTKVIHYKRQPPAVRGVSMKRKGKLNRNQVSDTLEVPVADAAQPEQSSGRLSLVVSTMVAIFIVVAILGLETQLVVTTNAMTEQIGFSVDKLTASIYGSK